MMDDRAAILVSIVRFFALVDYSLAIRRRTRPYRLLPIIALGCLSAFCWYVNFYPTIAYAIYVMTFFAFVLWLVPGVSLAKTKRDESN